MKNAFIRYTKNQNIMNIKEFLQKVSEEAEKCGCRFIEPNPMISQFPLHRDYRIATSDGSTDVFLGRIVPPDASEIDESVPFDKIDVFTHLSESLPDLGSTYLSYRDTFMWNDTKTDLVRVCVFDLWMDWKTYKNAK